MDFPQCPRVIMKTEQDCEQDFFLVVANVTQYPGTYTSSAPNLASDPVPTPWGSSYSLNIPLQPPLVGGQPESAVVNFLIPRSQFLNSPLGQAVMLGHPAQGASGSGPLLTDISSLTLGTTQASLDCYWQALAVTSDPTLCGAGTPGTPTGHFSTVTVVGDQETCTPGSASSNCAAGGVPSNPSLEAANSAPSLQAVLTLNLSFVNEQPGAAVSTSVYLDALIAGLMDNATGGINGTLVDETRNLSFLGLSPVVMKALANVTQVSTGVFGAPTSVASPPPPSPCSGFGCLWNAVSGVFSTLTGFVGAVWDTVVATANYLHNLAYGLTHLVAQGAEWVAATTVTAVEVVGSALEAALQALLAFVESAITTLLGTAIHPLQQAFTDYWRSVESPLGEAQNYTSQGQSPPTSSLVSVWSALGGSVFMDTMLLSTVLAAVVTVIMTVNLGTSFLFPILLTVVITAALQESPLGTLLSDLQSAFEQLLSGSTVQAVESWVDAHPSLLSDERSMTHPAGARSAQTTGRSDPGWPTLIEILSVSVTISFGFKFVVKELNTCAQPSQKNNIACSWFVIGAGIALEVVAIGMHLVSLTQPVPSGLHILGLILSILATVITGIRAEFEELKGLKVIEGLVAILGVVAIGVSLSGIPG